MILDRKPAQRFPPQIFHHFSYSLEMAVETSSSPLSGLWQPQSHLKNLYYGPSCVQKHLLSILPSQSSKAFVITGRSIATKTPLILQLETLLGTHYAGTFAHIKQHGPVAEVDQATDLIARSLDRYNHMRCRRLSNRRGENYLISLE